MVVMSTRARRPAAGALCFAVLLGAVTFAGSYSFTSLAPILPLRGRDLGASYAQLGALSLWLGLVFAACAFPAGILCDRLGSAPIMAVAVVTGVVSGCSFLLARTYSALIVARSVQALSSACFWPAVEALACVRGKHLTGYLMGWLLSGYAVGGAVGSVASGWMYQELGPRSPFAVALCSSILLAFMSALLFRQIRRAPEADAYANAANAGACASADGEAAGSATGGSWQPVRIAFALSSGLVYVACLATFLTFGPAYAQSRGVGAGAIGGMVSLYWFGRIVASYLMGPVSDRIGREKVLVPALLLGSVALVAFVAASGRSAAPLMFVASFLVGLGSGACAPASTAFASDAAPARSKGTAMGLFESSCNLGYLAAGWVGGSLALRFGEASPYLFGAGLSALWAFVVLGYAARDTFRTIRTAASSWPSCSRSRRR